MRDEVCLSAVLFVIDITNEIEYFGDDERIDKGNTILFTEPDSFSIIDDYKIAFALKVEENGVFFSSV